MSNLDSNSGIRFDNVFFLQMGSSQDKTISRATKISVKLIAGSVDIFDKNKSKVTFSKAGDELVLEARSGFALNETQIASGASSSVLVVVNGGEISNTPKGGK